MTTELNSYNSSQGPLRIHLPDMEAGLLTDSFGEEEQQHAPPNKKETFKKILRATLPTIAICGTIALAVYYATNRVELKLEQMQNHFDSVIDEGAQAGFRSTQN